ncbi:MAG: hypothetical protein ACLTDR_04890 [Adlercreutzia equolifaciens]
MVKASVVPRGLLSRPSRQLLTAHRRARRSVDVANKLRAFPKRR